MFLCVFTNGMPGSENFAHGYGGKFGVQTDRKDKSAFGADERKLIFVIVLPRRL